MKVLIDVLEYQPSILGFVILAARVLHYTSSDFFFIALRAKYNYIVSQLLIFNIESLNFCLNVQHFEKLYV